MQWSQTLRLFWANKTFNYSVLILVTLLGVVLPCWYLQQNSWVISLILGVIAAALAESDDSFTGRMKALVLTFFCFALASFSIELLFKLPLLFALGLFISTFGFIMLGALGPKYASIAFGSLLIAIYTMLGAEHSTNLWFQPVLLLSGAAWYYLMSMLWQLIWPMQPVQQSLATVFLNLAAYLEAKAELFHPASNLTPQPLRMQETKLNASTVKALNECKEILLARSKKGQIDGPSDRFLTIYFMAQDIHERANSSHYRYQDLAQEFERSDVLFRFHYLLQQQAQSCKDVAHAIRLSTVYHYSDKSMAALDELQRSLNHLKAQPQYRWNHLVAQLTYLFNNLSMVDSQLANLNNPDVQRLEEGSLSDQAPHTLISMWQRITAHLKTDSQLFRHAIRMSLALTLGYGIIQALALDKGYWILMTTLFVCQPNYSATRQKLTDRIIGTVSGLLLGAFLLAAFPSQESQYLFIVFSGIMFFALRMNNYGYATGFITLLVLFCFNQLGDGYGVVLPRLVDTFIGCALAVAAVSLILPDWHSRRLHRVLADSIDANKRYLEQTIGQYLTGKQDNLNYRIARRNAHNQDANLSISISNMLAEPDKHRGATEESFRFLTLSHTMLGYISALGAHRVKIDDENAYQQVSESHHTIHKHLNILQHQLNNHSDKCELSSIGQSDLEKRLNEWRDDDESSTRLVLQQLHLIYRLLPELHRLAAKLAGRSSKQPASPS